MDVNQRDVEMVQMVSRVSRQWESMGGAVEVLPDGVKLCFGDEGPCVTVSDSTLRKLGRWLIAALRVLARKLGVGV